MSVGIDHAGATSAEAASGSLPRWFEIACRYGLSASGPMAIAGAHFIASLMFLRVSAPTDFGVFSFVLIVMPLCMSMSGALFGAPIAGAFNKGRAIHDGEMGTYLKTSLAFSMLSAIFVCAMLLAIGVRAAVSIPIGAYSGIMTLRWFARCLSYAKHRQIPAVLSDIAYSALVLGGLFGLLLSGHLTLETASLALLAASIAAVAMFGRDYLVEQFGPKRGGSLIAYLPVWRDLTRWSLAGVVLSEMTSNAHAYFVTFASGPKTFALLAVGSLMMRPVSLVLNALPDMERPVMARKIAAGDVKGAFRSVNEFRTAAGAMLLVTIALGAVVLTWFPHLIIKPGYDPAKVLGVFGFWIAISAVRTLRTPDSVFLQSAQQFSALARMGARACIVSLIATPILLFTIGPVASLGGILLGDIVGTAQTLALTRAWKQAHA